MTEVSKEIPMVSRNQQKRDERLARRVLERALGRAGVPVKQRKFDLAPGFFKQRILTTKHLHDAAVSMGLRGAGRVVTFSSDHYRNTPLPPERIRRAK